jgi:hypothetical protein
MTVMSDGVVEPGRSSALAQLVSPTKASGSGLYSNRSLQVGDEDIVCVIYQRGHQVLEKIWSGS